MNKLLSFILILSLIMPGFAFAEKPESPSIGDMLGEILGGDNAYKSYLSVHANEGSGCADCDKKNANQPIDKAAFYQGWKLNCVALNGSQLCEGIKADDKLICDEPPKTPWYSNIWEKTMACGAGIKKSWQDFFHFMGQIGNYIINKDGAFTKTNAQISKAWNSMKSYMAMETTKYQDKYHVGATKAFFAVTGKMMSKFTAGLNALIAKAAPKVGCYNYKAKTRVICQVLAEFFAEPILMFKFIKMGPKVLKGTRVAKFFNFHKAKAVKEIVETTNKAKNLIVNPKTGLIKIDFIQPESKVLYKIMDNKKLNNVVASNKKVFQEVFPDKKALDELDIYLQSVSKQEADELADVLHILGQDKNKMSAEQYKDLVEEIKTSIKKSCEL